MFVHAQFSKRCLFISRPIVHLLLSWMNECECECWNYLLRLKTATTSSCSQHFHLNAATCTDMFAIATRDSSEFHLVIHLTISANSSAEYWSIFILLQLILAHLFPFSAHWSIFSIYKILCKNFFFLNNLQAFSWIKFPC